MSLRRKMIRIPLNKPVSDEEENKSDEGNEEEDGKLEDEEEPNQHQKGFLQRSSKKESG